MKNKGIKSMAEAVICQFTEISLVTPCRPIPSKIFQSSVLISQYFSSSRVMRIDIS